MASPSLNPDGAGHVAGPGRWRCAHTHARSARRLALLGLPLAALLGHPALAQTPPPSLQGSPLPRVLPPEAPKVGPGLSAPPPASAPAGPTGAIIDVKATELRGVTAYPAGTFADILTPLAGPVDQGRIEEARAAIVARYRADGYLFTAATVAVGSGAESGRLIFTVTEGRIVEVKLDGDIGPAGVQVLRFLNHLVDATPLDIATLERWLLLAQDVPGVSVRAVLRPSSGDPGALSLVAVVQRQSLSGLLTADNRGYSGTGPEQGLLNLSANSFTSFGERTDITLFYTARSTDVFGQASTELFLGGSGLKARAYVGHGTTDPTGALQQIGYHGDTTVAGLSLTYPLLRRRQQTLTLGAYFDSLSGTVETGTDTTKALASRDDLRVLRVGADYALRDLLLGGDRSAVTTISLRVSQGLRALGASRQGDALAGRVDEKIDFTKAGFEATRTQTLFSPWQDAAVALQTTLAGQYSGDILPTSEQFYLGGLRFNRGFYSGQVTGDRALTASVEAQLNTSVSLPGPQGRFDLGTQYYTFYDWGETWQSRKTDANARLGSAGLGIRTMWPHGVELDLEGVRRLTRQPLGKTGVVAKLPGDGIYWRLVGRF